MTQLTALKIAVGSLINDTKKITDLLDSRSKQLVFYPAIIEADIDYKIYCSEYNDIKDFCRDMSLDENSKIIKDKISELPSLTEKDFKFHNSAIPIFLLYVLFPLGIIIWINSYFKIASLNNKLKGAARTLNTTEFMLKALAD